MNRALYSIITVPSPGWMSESLFIFYFNVLI